MPQPCFWIIALKLNVCPAADAKLARTAIVFAGWITAQPAIPPNPDVANITGLLTCLGDVVVAVARGGFIVVLVMIVGACGIPVVVAAVTDVPRTLDDVDGDDEGDFMFC